MASPFFRCQICAPRFPAVEEGDATHIWTVSWWKDIESIRAFAGDEIDRAKYYTDDKKYLLEFEPTVAHYEAFDFAPIP